MSKNVAVDGIFIASQNYLHESLLTSQCKAILRKQSSPQYQYAGIAMRTGSDVAKPSASITLIHNNQCFVADISNAPKVTYSKHIFWHLFFNTVAINKFMIIKILKLTKTR